MNDLAIVGGGSWGTALAIALSPNFRRIRIWVFEAAVAKRLQEERRNELYLPGFELPTNVEVSTSFEEVLSGVSFVIGVMPSTHARNVYLSMRPHLTEDMTIVSATKGLEVSSLLRMSEVIEETLGDVSSRLVVMSGPSFAREVAAGCPTAIVAAAKNERAAALVQQAFSGRSFRLYTSRDTVGVEIGGAVKNVVAIGAGVCEGLGLGKNALAALQTRGLAEMTRLAEASGGEARTLSGLAGLGDLILTCNGELSRNRMVGIELTKGRSVEEITRSTRMVAEGVSTTKAAVELAWRRGVDMPIAEQMFAMLYQGRPPRDALRLLMERSLKQE